MGAVAAAHRDPAAGVRGRAVGGIAVSTDLLTLLVLVASVLVVIAMCLALWVWYRGWHPGELPW